MIDWKLNRVLEQTSKVPETTGQSVRPTQANSNGNSNLTKNVNQANRRGTAGVPGPQLNESTKTWSQMLGRATANSENWTTVSRKKKSNNNSNSNKFDNTEDFNAIKSRRLIIKPKAQIGDIDSLLFRNQINSLFKVAKFTIVVNTVEKSKTGQNIVLTTSPENTADDFLNNKTIWEHLFDPRIVRKDETWFKVIAHSINIVTFDEKMHYLQDEIQKFNSNMQLCDIPR